MGIIRPEFALKYFITDIPYCQEFDQQRISYGDTPSVRLRSINVRNVPIVMLLVKVYLSTVGPTVPFIPVVFPSTYCSNTLPHIMDFAVRCPFSRVIQSPQRCCPLCRRAAKQETQPPQTAPPVLFNQSFLPVYTTLYINPVTRSPC